MIYKQLNKSELDLLKDIDRKEVVNEVYYYIDKKLKLVDEYYNIEEWNLKELNEYIDRLINIQKRAGKIYGAFDNGKIVGLVALESKLIGEKLDQLKLDMLYISTNYRKQGIGKMLVNLVCKDAIKLGAKKLYISATPFKNTVDFYSALGAKITGEINKSLFELEPFDIHMTLDLENFIYKTS